MENITSSWLTLDLPVRDPSLPNVLLVDDQPARLLTYEAVLQGVGVRCVRALSGQEALGLLLKERFALILLDVSMPGLDGFETARLIRDHPRFEKTPIIFVTGVNISELDSLRGYEVGAIDYIPIPIVPEILRSKVAILVELYRRRTELEALNRDLRDTRLRLEKTFDADAREQKSRALLELADKFRSCAEIADLTFATAQTLGETLQVPQSGYASIDSNTAAVLVEREWRASEDVSFVPNALLSRALATCREELQRGETVVMDADAGVSLTITPIIEQGMVVSLLYLGYERSRTWQPQELNFLRETADRTRIAVERRRGERALSADLKVMRLLRDLAAKVIPVHGAQTLYDDVLAAAVFIAEADGGTLQLFDETAQTLTVVASQGLPESLVSRFKTLPAASGTSCGQALASGRRTFVEFRNADPHDVHGDFQAHFDHGLQSAQSTPLISRSGHTLGMVSTHWRTPHTFSDRTSGYTDLLARQAADLIERARTEQQLRDADRRKDEFIAVLAHELRNPLVPIRTGIELLKKAASEPAILETLRPMMERQIGHMVRMIDDLLDVSRITAGKIELRPQAVSVSSIVESAVDSNRAAMVGGKLDLKVEIKDPEFMLQVDPTRLSQVISNLIHNATKFTPAGGTVSVHAEFESNSEHKRIWVLRVIDTGIGISSTMLPRVFDLFVQAESAGQPKQTGLGIGLALAQRLTELHGGLIEARSRGVGLGSEFVVTIPAPYLAARRASSDTAATGALTGLRIIVIDDNQDGADVMGLLLEDFGAEVRVYYDGAAGLADLSAFNPSAALIDIGMPIMDGHETCRRIRAEFGDRLPLIALTGWGQRQDKELALSSGFNSHLTKPAKPEDVAATILSLMSEAQG
jgi:signal transduction histidine kinase